MKPLIQRELFQALHSPLYYGVSVFFLLFTSIWLFYIQNYFALETATLRPYFAGFPLALSLVVPALCMRLWAGERRSGTVEILLTLPFSEVELVMGKFISTLILLLFLFALSLPVPLSLFALGDFDRMLALTEYIGAILLSSLALAMSLFFSCLFKSQAASFLGTTALLALLMFINYLVPGLQYISLSYHFESFAKGLLDSRGLLYFILGTVLFLYLNVQVLHLRREE